MDELKEAKVFSEDDTPISNFDLSLLRQPISSSLQGFDEALQTYNNGTKEIKKLLSKECDVIYECKVCRNIFRSLNNFFSHKRIYCQSAFKKKDHHHFKNNGLKVQDISEITHGEQEINNRKDVSCIFAGSSIKLKDSNGIFDHNIQYKNTFSDKYNADHTINNELKQENDRRLILYPEIGSNVLNQSTLPNKNCNNKKLEIKDVQNMLEKSNDIDNLEANADQNDETANLFMCQVCNLNFQTKKTLKLHLELKHFKAVYFHKCPVCRKKFLSSAAVVEHLAIEHKKTNRQIRLMRENILKNCVDEASISKKTNMTKLKLQTEKMITKSINTELNCEAAKQKKDELADPYICPSCLKKFYRKAVYTSHVQLCSDNKYREQELLKKRKTKDGTKIQSKESLVECEDNLKTNKKKRPISDNKRNQMKIKKGNFSLEKNNKNINEESSEDKVDWNLDDEDEEKNLENIKKEVILDEHKKVPDVENVSTSFLNYNSNSTNITEKINEHSITTLNSDLKFTEDAPRCPTCHKIFETNEKLEYHLSFYHSRQKRFKCKMCEYQGYRKKDTMNHLNFVHNANITLEGLNNYTETVLKAVNEEDIKVQNELKKNQLKLKRKIARENQRKKIRVKKIEIIESEKEEKTNDLVEFKIKSSAVNTNSTKVLGIEMKYENNQNHLLNQIIHKDEFSSIEAKEPLDNINKVPLQYCSGTTNYPFSIISTYGKIVKKAPIIESNNTKVLPQYSRPIRNKIKPVRKDFLYDLSDLLKKEADAHREQSFQSNITIKREFRKRAMSTHNRETPNINVFDQVSLFSTITSTSESTTHRLVDKNLRNRRLSVFEDRSSEFMIHSHPRLPLYKAPATHKNAGIAYQMALREFDNNCVSLYEPKFLWTICFQQENKRSHTPIILPNISAASNILQRLSEKSSNDEVKKNTEIKDSSKLSAEQLCKKFELFNFSNSNKLAASDLNSTDNSNVYDVEKSESNTDQVKSKIETEIIVRKSNSALRKSRRYVNRKQSTKSFKSIPSRLTVMQRLQKNKIRKTNEQQLEKFFDDTDCNS